MPTRPNLSSSVAFLFGLIAAAAPAQAADFVLRFGSINTPGTAAFDEVLVPFAKAYSGLTDSEIREVDSFIRRNTLEKFGPVCTVKPELVFESAFEGIQRSNRHKSGIAVRFPRMAASGT